MFGFHPLTGKIILSLDFMEAFWSLGQRQGEEGGRLGWATPGGSPGMAASPRGPLRLGLSPACQSPIQEITGPQFPDSYMLVQESDASLCLYNAVREPPKIFAPFTPSWPPSRPLQPLTWTSSAACGLTPG